MSMIFTIAYLEVGFILWLFVAISPDAVGLPPLGLVLDWGIRVISALVGEEY